MLGTKQEIINQLNVKLNDQRELIQFCDELSNDLNEVIKYLNKLIKYAFINKGIKDPIWSLLYCLDDMDEEYQKYLENRQKSYFSSIFKKTTSKPTPVSPLLEDTININDVQGLKFPAIEVLTTICENNKKKRQEEAQKEQQKQAYYKEKRIFEETEFIYARTELITIDRNLLYYNPHLSGNIEEDYNFLYSDERYKNNELNPLQNSYEINIALIKGSKDIIIHKLGNLFEIVNGRHRILYILKHGIPQTIPVRMVRRIEDREFNIILKKLQDEFSVKIYKNNILNDEPNIIIIYNEIMYEIKNTTELKDFYNNLVNKNDNLQYVKTTFEFKDRCDSGDLTKIYKQQIFNKYLELGDFILTSNYTDIIHYFDNSNNSIFYSTFMLLQSEYHESLIFNYDFKVVYQLLNNYDESISNKTSYSKRKKHH